MMDGKLESVRHLEKARNKALEPRAENSGEN
jgi:hypothetical protein